MNARHDGPVTPFDLDESRREPVWERCLTCGTEWTHRMLQAAIAPRFPERVGWCVSCRTHTKHGELTWWDAHSVADRRRLGEQWVTYQPDWKP